MKTINTYILEKLQLGKKLAKSNSNNYEYFPESKTELEQIIYNITKHHKSNKIIDLNMIDTSKITDMSELFSGTKYASSYVYDISRWNVSKCEDFSYMFYNNKNIETLDLSEWKLSTTCHHIEMFGMFANCTNLKTVIGLENWDTKKVSRISRMFSDCEKLENIDISTWNMSFATQFEGVFVNCENLKSIGDISGWDVSNVFWMQQMFYKCKNLKSIGDISNWNLTRMRKHGDVSEMFYECTNLTGLGDLDKWKLNKTNTKITKMLAKTKIQKPYWY